MPMVSLTPQMGQREPMAHWVVCRLPRVSFAGAFSCAADDCGPRSTSDVPDGSWSDSQASVRLSSGVDFRREATMERRLE
jgi:hypothetical protein